jgi:hypothetical protein
MLNSQVEVVGSVFERKGNSVALITTGNGADVTCMVCTQTRAGPAAPSPTD